MAVSTTDRSGYLYCLLAAIVATRALRVGVYVRGDQVRTVAWFITRTAPVSTIVRVGRTSYDGLIASGAPSGLFTMLTLVTGSRSQRLYFTLDTARRSARQAETLRHMFGDAAGFATTLASTSDSPA